MTQIVPVSIGRDYKEVFDEFVVISTGKSLSKEVCKAIRFFVESYSNAPMLANDDKWKDFIDKSSKEDIMEMNTLICDLSQQLVAKWKSLK